MDGNIIRKTETFVQYIAIDAVTWGILNNYGLSCVLTKKASRCKGFY